MSYSTWADDFLSDMNEVITLTPYTVTGNGQHIAGTPRQYHASISGGGDKPIYSATGTVAFSTGTVLFHPKALDGTVLTQLTADSVIAIPNDDGTVSKPRIVQIDPLDDEQGIVAWQIHF